MRRTHSWPTTEKSSAIENRTTLFRIARALLCMIPLVAACHETTSEPADLRAPIEIQAFAGAEAIAEAKSRLRDAMDHLALLEAPGGATLAYQRDNTLDEALVKARAAIQFYRTFLSALPSATAVSSDEACLGYPWLDAHTLVGLFVDRHGRFVVTSTGHQTTIGRSKQTISHEMDVFVNDAFYGSFGAFNSSHDECALGLDAGRMVVINPVGIGEMEVCVQAHSRHRASASGESDFKVTYAFSLCEERNPDNPDDVGEPI